MKFIVLDRDENRIKNVTTFSTRRKVKINSLDNIEFDTYDDFLEKYFRLLYKDDLGKWHEYIISSIEMIHDESGIKYHVFAENSLVEIRGDFLDDLRAINSTAKDAVDKLLYNSRWRSKVESTKISTTNFYRITAFEGLNKLLSDFGGEIDTEIKVSGEKVIDRYLIYKDIISYDNGKRFSFSKDISSIKRTISDDEIITALYGYGKGEELKSETGTSYGRKIDFSEVNKGEAYIENIEATKKYGFNKKPRFGTWIFDDITDKNILLKETKKMLEKLSKPNISYEVDVIDLKSYGINFEGTSCGDIVIIRDYELNESLKSRVLELEEDLDKIETTKLILGNTRKYILDDDRDFKNQVSNFLSKEKAYDKLVLNPIDISNVVYMDEVVKHLNNQFNSGTSNISFDVNRGLVITDKKKESESSWIIEISSLGFRIANSKLSNGQWNFRTFGTGDGFSADLIKTGVLEGGKVKFDLQQGTFLIGKSPTDYEIYYDGTKLFINVESISSTISTSVEKFVKENKDILRGEKGEKGNVGPKGSPGVDGVDGKDGVSIKSTITEYSLSDSPDIKPESGWSTKAIFEEGKFLWRRNKITYSDGKTDYIGEEYILDPSSITESIYQLSTNFNQYTESSEKEFNKIIEMKKTIEEIDGKVTTVSLVSTKAQQKADSFEQVFTRLENAISSNEEETKRISAVIKSGLDKEGNTFTEWGSSGNSIVRVGADGIDMISNNVSTMKLKEGIVDANSLYVKDTIGFGNHTAQKYKTEFTIFSWTGGN